MPNRRRFVASSSAAAVSAGLVALPAWGQANIISRSARIMVGFPAGSSPDVVARLLAEHMKGYAPSVIVDNRPGAGGRLPLEALKGAERDGSVMVLTPGDQVALFPHVYAKLVYDALRDFAPVSTVCTVQFLLTIGSLVPADVKTVGDFVAWCRANPKLASYGSPGEGTRPHFMAASLARSAGVPMTHVPYKGGRAPRRAGPSGGPDCRCSERSLKRSSPRPGRPPARSRDDGAQARRCPAGRADGARSRLSGDGGRRMVRPVCPHRRAE